MLRAPLIASALAKACRLDVVAFKPGNVSLCSPGHGMQARDFLASAAVAVPCLARSSASVGERIESAVSATRAAVACNTNLGIILLLAPLAAAACERSAGDLRVSLAQVLARLTVADAELCFRAIRLAQPAGLGRVEAQDVAAPPSVDLRTAMQLAAGHDAVARQYVNDFAEVFDVGFECVREARQRWRSLAWATTACYLAFLAREADTHIVRKWGRVVAEAVSARAGAVEKALKACQNPREVMPLLTAFDHELKTRGVNPGTSADLTVASVSALLLQERLSQQSRTGSVPASPEVRGINR